MKKPGSLLRNPAARAVVESSVDEEGKLFDSRHTLADEEFEFQWDQASAATVARDLIYYLNALNDPWNLKLTGFAPTESPALAYLGVVDGLTPAQYAAL